MEPVNYQIPRIYGGTNNNQNNKKLDSSKILEALQKDNPKEFPWGCIDNQGWKAEWYILACLQTKNSTTLTTLEKSLLEKIKVDLDILLDNKGAAPISIYFYSFMDGTTINSNGLLRSVLFSREKLFQEITRTLMNVTPEKSNTDKEDIISIYNLLQTQKEKEKENFQKYRSNPATNNFKRLEEFVKTFLSPTKRDARAEGENKRRISEIGYNALFEENPKNNNYLELRKSPQSDSTNSPLSSGSSPISFQPHATTSYNQTKSSSSNSSSDSKQDIMNRLSTILQKYEDTDIFAIERPENNFSTALDSEAAKKFLTKYGYVSFHFEDYENELGEMIEKLNKKLKLNSKKQKKDQSIEDKKYNDHKKGQGQNLIEVDEWTEAIPVPLENLNHVNPYQIFDSESDLDTNQDKNPFIMEDFKLVPPYEIFDEQNIKLEMEIEKDRLTELSSSSEDSKKWLAINHFHTIMDHNLKHIFKKAQENPTIKAELLETFYKHPPLRIFQRHLLFRLNEPLHNNIPSDMIPIIGTQTPPINELNENNPSLFSEHIPDMIKTDDEETIDDTSSEPEILNIWTENKKHKVEIIDMTKSDIDNEETDGDPSSEILDIWTSTETPSNNHLGVNNNSISRKEKRRQEFLLKQQNALNDIEKQHTKMNTSFDSKFEGMNQSVKTFLLENATNVYQMKKTILNHLISKNDTEWLVDYNDKKHPWIAFKMSDNQLYFINPVNVKDIQKNNSDNVYVDIDSFNETFEEIYSK